MSSSAAPISQNKTLPKCVVRGSINHDEYFFVDEISKPGETKSSKRHESRVGGKGANQAAAIARAGGSVLFYGTVGRDLVGTWVVQELEGMGMDMGGVIVSDEDSTGRAIIQVSDDGENSIILFPGANHSDLHERRKLRSSDPSASIPNPNTNSWFPDSTHLLLQNEIAFTSTITSLRKAKDEFGLCTIINPSPMLSTEQIKEFPWDKVDWLMVNEGESEALLKGLGHVSAPPSKLDWANVAEKFASLPVFANTNVICTLGAEGVRAFGPALASGSGKMGREGVYIPAAKLRGEFRDTTGAGDCFTGYFVAGLMEAGDTDKEGVVKILKMCNQAAGMSVERPGTIDSVPTRDEVLARMAEVER